VVAKLTVFGLKELLSMHVPLAIAAHSYTVTHSAHKLISRCTQVTGDFLCAYALQHVHYGAVSEHINSEAQLVTTYYCCTDA
jgi:hypothetical protein